MSLLDVVSRLKAKLGKGDLQARARALDLPSGIEPGLRHPVNAGHVLCRDDQVVELAAGPTAAVLVDGANGQVTLQGTALALSAQHLHLHAPPGGLYVGYQRLLPYWFSPPVDPLQSWLTKAPLVLNDTLFLNTKVAIDPSPGPTPNPALAEVGLIALPLAALMTPRPLLGPNEQLWILARNLGSLLKSLAVDLEN